MLPKATLESPQSSHVSVLGRPVWRNQGEHKPSQTKIMSSTVSAFVLPLSLLPDAHVSTQGNISGTSLLATAPCSQEHDSDGADGHQQGPQAKQPPGAAEGAHQGKSLGPQPCQKTALLEASAHNWEDFEGLDIRLLLFYKIYRTVSSYGNWCLEKWVSNADEIFASLLLDCTSAYCVTVQKRRLLRKSYKFHLHGSKIWPWRLENQSTDA